MAEQPVAGMIGKVIGVPIFSKDIEAKLMNICTMDLLINREPEMAALFLLQMAANKHWRERN